MGPNYWFGYVLWTMLAGEAVALTYAGGAQPLILTPYIQGAASPSQIWGMRAQNADNYQLLQSYNFQEDQVMDIQSQNASSGTPIIAWSANYGSNQYWQYQYLSE